MATRSDINWRVMAHSGKKANPECKGCSNVSDEGYCIYILKHGHRRPCKPGPHGGCAVKDTESERGVIPPPSSPGAESPSPRKGHRKNPSTKTLRWSFTAKAAPTRT